MPKMVDLEKLSTLETEIKLLEGKISVKQSDLENITRECNVLQDKTNKEIAQQKQQCDIECQGKINEANRILKNAESKLKTAEKRKEESEVIEEQVKNLTEKQKAFEDTQKELDRLRSSYSEKEKKAELLIEQYEKKLKELEEASKNKK